ncbi:MAG: hypothetical protein K2X27_26370 [Candidatus Obscuribacterales bacterium]|nr:hypothetical protein [Candidatus Obscuribacterales bacterium]
MLSSNALSWASAEAQSLAREVSKISSVSYFDDVQLSDALLAGQAQAACLIACSDMGAYLPYVCSDPTVKLHVFQNFGHSCLAGGVFETMAYTAIEHFIVYGHFDCRYAKDRDAELLEKDPSLREELERYNVLRELRTFADNATGLPLKNLKLHGWVHDKRQGHLQIFDPGLCAFVIAKSPQSLS